MSKPARPARNFLPFTLPATSGREVVDTLVIFSICLVAYMAVVDWGGMVILQKVFGTQAERPSFMYFFGVALVVFSARRISDQRRERAKRLAAELQARTIAMRDPLTQLPNRRQFQNDVSAVLKDSDNKMSVLLLGLDQFKKLNEVYGHLGCDEALLQIGSRIRDRAAPGDIFARIGDDEFALCLASCDPERARRIACTLVETVKMPVQIGIEQHSIGASVGIAQAGRGHVTVDELLRCAHVALSRARTLHTEFCFFDPKMDAHIRERSLLEKDLKAAIGGDALRPYYQPIIDLKTRRIVSFESLGTLAQSGERPHFAGYFYPARRGTRHPGHRLGPTVWRRLPRRRALARRYFTHLQFFAVAAQRPDLRGRHSHRHAGRGLSAASSGS